MDPAPAVYPIRNAKAISASNADAESK